MPTSFQWADALPTAAPLGPALALTAGLLGTVVLDLALGRRYRWVPWLASVATVLCAAIVLVFRLISYEAPAEVWGGLWVEDAMGLWGQSLVVGTLALTLGAVAVVPALRNAPGELFYFLLALGTALVLAVQATNGLSVFLTLEMASLATYLLVAWPRGNPASAEVGLKYFLFGAASAGLMAYGLSWLYGLAGGSLGWDATAGAALAAQPAAPVAVALGLVAAGLLFKTGAAPFHFWAPDAYQAAHPVLAALASTAPKVAGAVALWRLGTLAGAHPVLAEYWPVGVGAVAAVGLLVGNLGALRQASYTRLLAYSGVGHTGFMLLGVAVGGTLGATGLMIYLTAYLLLNMPAFWLANPLHRRMGTLEYAQWRPTGPARLPVALVTGLMGLAGLPPTPGFWAKLAILLPVWEIYSATGNTLWLILLCIAGASIVLGFAYYLRVVAYVGRPAAKMPHPTYGEGDIPPRKPSTSPPSEGGAREGLHTPALAEGATPLESPTCNSQLLTASPLEWLSLTVLVLGLLAWLGGLGVLLSTALG